MTFQGEGASKGTQLMPLLFCLAQHVESRGTSGHQLEEGEHLFAFLDDLCIVCH